MADDGQIRIGLSIDISGLSDAEDSATESAAAIGSAYEDSAETISEAQQAISEAVSQLAAQQDKFAKAAADGSAAAKVAIDEYAASVKVAQENLAQLSETQGVISERGAPAITEQQPAQAIAQPVVEPEQVISANTAQSDSALEASDALHQVTESSDEVAGAQAALTETIEETSAAVDILTASTEANQAAEDKNTQATGAAVEAGQTQIAVNQATAESAAALADANNDVAASAEVSGAKQVEAAQQIIAGNSDIAASVETVVNFQQQQEDAITRMTAAQSAYNTVAGKSTEAAIVLGQAFDSAIQSGLSLTEAMETAVGAVQGLTKAELQAAAASAAMIQANEGVEASAGAITSFQDQQEQAIARTESVMAAYNAEAKRGGETSLALAEAFDAATASGASFVDAMAAGVAAAESYSASTQKAVQANSALAVSEEAAKDQVASQVDANAELAASRAGSAVAADTAASSADRLSAAYAEFNALAKTSSKTAVALTNALKEAQDSGMGLAEAMETATAAVAAYTSAADGAAGATGALAGSQRAAASSSMAAQGALRTMEGSMFGATRAAASFLTTTLKLGPILEAAFPIIGAAALVSILYQVGESLYNTEQEAQKAAEAINKAYADAADKIQQTNDEIDLQNSKLQDQIDKLEGHPNNGLQTALDEDIVEADKLQNALDGVLKKIESINNDKNIQISFTTSLISNQVATGPITKKTTDIVEQANVDSQTLQDTYRKQLTEAGSDQQKILAATAAYHQGVNEVIAKANSQLKPLLDENVKMQQDALREREIIQEVLEPSLLAKPIAAAVKQTDYAPVINDIKMAMGLMDKLQDQTKAMEAQEPLEAKKNQLTQEKELNSEANQAAQQHLRDLETQFDAENTIGEKYRAQTAAGPVQITTTQKLDPGAAAAYWQKYLGDFRQGSEEYKAVLQKIEAAENQYSKHQEKLGKPTETKDEIQTYWSGVLFAYQEGSARYNAMVAKIQSAEAMPTSPVDKALVTEAAELKKQGDNDQKILEDMQKTYTGLVAKENELNAALMKKQETEAMLPAEDQHQKILQEIQQQISTVEEKREIGIIDPMKALKELKTLHDQEIAEDQRFIQQEIAIYQGDETKETELDKQLGEAHRKAMEEQLKDTTKILQQEELGFKKVYGAITQDVNGAITQIITTTESPAQAFAKMFDQLLGQLATFVLEWIEKKTEMWILDKALGASAAAATVATNKTQAVLTITSDAGVAAAGNMAYWSAINPLIAPAMAATAFAVTESFAAFEQGGVVNGPRGMGVPIMAHAGERVLSVPQSQNFERMVNQPAKPQSNFNLNYYGQVNAYDRNGMRSTLKAHASDILDIVREGRGRGMLK